jgi:tetratricopeptide (TPR) repeat protein
MLNKIKNIFFILTLIIFSLNSIPAFSAASGGSDASSGGNNAEKNEVQLYKEGKKLVYRAKKLEKKNKSEKAKKLYLKAYKKFEKAYSKNKKSANILNYLGFTLRKTGDLVKAEKYYLEGLKLDASHLGINEYLGELYLETNRIDLAKKRLDVLNGCNCEEYTELKNLIENQ